MTVTPDPILTANVYAAGRLDELLGQALAPFWRSWRETEPMGQDLRLWILRYGCGGEHLKLRLHGPAALRESIKKSLEETMAHFFETSRAGRTTASRIKAGSPIDPEDSFDHLDSTLVWTQYRRHPSSLGWAPLLEYDPWVEHLTASLTRGCELILSHFELGEDQTLPFARRLRLLLVLIRSGLEGLELSTERRLAYLHYHRDTLIRSFTLGRNRSHAKAREIRGRWKQELTGPRAEILAIPDFVHEPGLEDWKHALRGLRSSLTPFLEDSSYQLDPFAREPLYFALLKVLHGMANAVGCNPTNEGFVVHWLLNQTVSRETSIEFEDSILLAPGESTVTNRPTSAEPGSEADEGNRFNIDEDYQWAELISAASEPERCIRPCQLRQAGVDRESFRCHVEPPHSHRKSVSGSPVAKSAFQLAGSNADAASRVARIATEAPAFQW